MTNIVQLSSDLLPFFKGDPGEAGGVGDAGNDGASAYELAVAGGFVGSEAAWLLSLKGETGDVGDAGNDGASAYEIAAAGGFVGSEAAWLLSLKGETGDVGDAGNDGASAYEIAVAGGFVGSEAAWLLSLKGEAGDAGSAGADGADFTPPALAPWEKWIETFFDVMGNVGSAFTIGSVGGGSIYSAAAFNYSDELWSEGVAMRSSATANSGYRSNRTGYTGGPNSIAISGGKKFRAAWRPNALINTLVRSGYHDTLLSTAPVNGVWFEQVGGQVVGKTAAGGANSTTDTAFTLVSGNVYVFDLSINADASLATFSVLSAVGDLLWSDTINTNLPTQKVMVGTIATSSNTAITDLGVLYMMGFGSEAGYARARG
jgi:hypothetical protein